MHPKRWAIRHGPAVVSFCVAEGDSLKFTMWNDAGESETVELDGPGGTIRVVVGEPGRQSGVWRIWATRNTSDAYIGVRAILGYQKWSLHESGDWRCQWINVKGQSSSAGAATE